ncbi:MAG TPA: RluA family pseudouridine synthase [Novosphingobium sp.]|nr:RluA family pseudouridine synthase [Novosphingobium sp.]
MTGITTSGLPILFEDGEALVIDKPASLPLDQPRAGGLSLENHSEALKLGFARAPSPVHRLDRDTSGCLLLARNPKALKRFAAAFEERAVSKRYLGIVAGSIAQEEGTIELNLSKISSAADGWRMIPAKKGKPAITHWRKLAEAGGNTLVEFRPETGRTHQIRVHALHGLGAALLGDPVYGDGKGARRTMLHAVELIVPRTGKEAIHAFASMPADFVALGFDPLLAASD